MIPGKDGGKPHLKLADLLYPREKTGSDQEDVEDRPLTESERQALLAKGTRQRYGMEE